jgi:hypothetical protein
MRRGFDIISEFTGGGALNVVEMFGATQHFPQPLDLWRFISLGAFKRHERFDGAAVELGENRLLAFIGN